MTASKNLIQAAAGSAGGDFYGYTIDNSVRFASPSDKLTRTNSGSGSTKGCFSMWVKRSKLNPGAVVQLIGTGVGEFYFSDSTQGGGVYYPDAIGYYEYFNSGYQGAGTSSINASSAYNVFRDVSAWYHVFIVWDTTLATATDRYQIWVNNQRVTLTVDSNVTQNTLARWFASGDIVIGNNSAGTKPCHSYLAEVVGIEGTAYAPTDFAVNKNGVWIPKNVSGLTFGTNGFYLKFNNSGALGTDSSGNGNNFTVSGLTSSDQMIDTPTNNFATLNPLLQYTTGAGYSGAIYQGNLEKQGPADNSFTGAYSTIAMAPNTGKWYSEHYLVTENRNAFGISYAPTDAGSSTTPNNSTVYGYYAFAYSGWAYSLIYATSSDSSPQTITNVNSGSVVGILYDSDASEVTFYVNGTQAGTAVSVPVKTYVFFSDGYGVAPQSYQASNFGQDSTFNGRITAGSNTDANGIGDFKYTVPSGALALCTANLPEPAIGPNSTTTSDEHFDTALYTGNGTTTTVSSLNFQPDLTWIKSRTYARFHALADVLRGSTKFLSSNSTSAEDTVDSGNGVVWNSTGFEVDASSDWNSLNESGANIVAWNWKANGSGVSNTDGSITSTVSANTDAGFSIVSFTATGSNPSTIGHGLGVAPDLIILKVRNSGTGDWLVYHHENTSAPETDYLVLHSTLGTSDYPVWADTAPTSSVFSLGTYSQNVNGYTFIAYCFAEVEGFSKFGSYTGNNSNDGPFVYTGFRPAFLLVKDANTTGYWPIYDSARMSYNAIKEYVMTNSSNAETSLGTENVDFLSNGFKLRANNANSGQNNVSGNTYIYMAFAENPFKYANAR